MNKMKYPRIGIVQRVLPGYRAQLFDMLADANGGNVSVFAGEGRKLEMISAAIPQKAKYFPAKNYHILHGMFYACWQGGLLRWLRQWKPDVLIMEANPRYLHSRAALRWMRKNHGKVIGWGLGAPVILQDILGVRNCLRKHFLQKFDAVITYSSQGAREYAKLGFPHAKIFIAPNAASAKPLHPLPERHDTYRGKKPIVVFVGRLQPRKRVDVLIRACAGLPADQQPLLWIIGDGPNRGGLESLAKEIYPLSTFFGALHGEDLAQRLKLADLFVLPGTGGLAVQEAMSFGLPVIVGEADGTQADLVREENGWLLTDPTPDQLGKLIANALGDIHALRKRGRAGFRIVSEEINLEAMVLEFGRAVSEVLNG